MCLITIFWLYFLRICKICFSLKVSVSCSWSKRVLELHVFNLTTTICIDLLCRKKLNKTIKTILKAPKWPDWNRLIPAAPCIFPQWWIHPSVGDIGWMLWSVPDIEPYFQQGLSPNIMVQSVLLRPEMQMSCSKCSEQLKLRSAGKHGACIPVITQQQGEQISAGNFK